jgi:hypothetical protein
MKYGLFTVALVLVTSGVAAQHSISGTHHSDRSPQVAPAAHAATLIATNYNWLDVHVYLVRDGSYTPVGVVRSFTTETMQLSNQATTAGGDVRLAADPIGGTGIYLSQSLVIPEGATVAMVVENVLSQSTTIVRAP